MYLGVKAVLAKSFERIHAANLVNFGILPLTFADPADYDRVDQGDELEIPRHPGGPRRGRAAGAGRHDQGRRASRCSYEPQPRARSDIICAGGLLAVHGRAVIDGQAEITHEQRRQDQGRRPRSSRWTATR